MRRAGFDPALFLPVLRPRRAAWPGARASEGLCNRGTAAASPVPRRLGPEVFARGAPRDESGRRLIADRRKARVTRCAVRLVAVNQRLHEL